MIFQLFINTFLKVSIKWTHHGEGHANSETIVINGSKEIVRSFMIPMEEWEVWEAWEAWEAWAAWAAWARKGVMGVKGVSKEDSKEVQAREDHASSAMTVINGSKEIAHFSMIRAAPDQLTTPNLKWVNQSINLLASKVIKQTIIPITTT